MKAGQWLAPRHGSREVFEKDFPGVDINGLEVYCPGCKSPVKLARKSPSGKIGGWCARCNRGVAP